MATDLLVHESWFDKFKYHDAERKFYEQMNGPVATAAEDDEEDDTDVFSRDEEDDREAVKLREERLQQYTEKKAKKLALVAKSSILLDVEPWDEETGMAQLEACVHSVQLDGLTLGCSKLVPWATASAGSRSSASRRTRWGPTCWKRRSPSLQSTCRASTLLLSTRSKL
uniref:Eukaryotic translation elongation factor 1 delta n=1 Tax=Myotis myotis TaxID=51298 RepID=A0A7J7Z4X2_MYOMY|nr:hypothetical protein mMyoMyo1_010596 [Myotis myotis]